MAKSNSNIENTNVERLESFIIETLIDKEKIVIPDFGHLELKTVGDRRTVFFRSSTGDDNGSFLQIMSADNEAVKTGANSLYSTVTVPLKAEKVVTLPQIGVFRPNKKDDGKIHISFIPSSLLRKRLNGDEERNIIPINPIKETELKEEIKEEVKDIFNDIKSDGKIETQELTTKKIEIPQKPGFTTTNWPRTSKIGDSVVPSPVIGEKISSGKIERTSSKVGETIVPQDAVPERRFRNLSGTVLFLVLLIALIVIIVFTLFPQKKKVEDRLEIQQSSEIISLPSLAMQKYGHPAFWIYIYDANKDKLSSPLNIPKGVELKIPDLKAEYDVDLTDDLEIKRANIRADMILNRLKAKN